jgi:DNA-binding XRE family transcriptional regulator
VTAHQPPSRAATYSVGSASSSDATQSDVRSAVAAIIKAREAVGAAVDAEREVLMAALRERREQAGLTQTAIADAIGLSRTQVTNIEADRGASLDAVIAYAGALGFRLTLVEAL